MTPNGPTYVVFLNDASGDRHGWRDYRRRIIWSATRGIIGIIISFYAFLLRLLRSCSHYTYLWWCILLSNNSFLTLPSLRYTHDHDCKTACQPSAVEVIQNNPSITASLSRPPQHPDPGALGRPLQEGRKLALGQFRRQLIHNTVRAFWRNN